jgi:hypothetical protein
VEVEIHQAVDEQPAAAECRAQLHPALFMLQPLTQIAEGHAQEESDADKHQS